MALKIKYFIKLCVFCGLHIFYVFPIKKKNIYFVAFLGQHICCNPKYIYKYMKEKNLPCKYIWCCKNKSDSNDKSITYIKSKSIKSIFYLMTCGVIITNDQIPDYIPFRKKQMLIETWHGGGLYKKDTYGDELNTWYLVKSYLAQRKRKILSEFISSSALFTKNAIIDFSLPEEKFVSYGMPRNDVFFNNKLVNDINTKIRNQFEIEDNTIIVIYAPTFRNNVKNAEFSFSLNIEALEKTIMKKFGEKVVFFMRGHHTFEMCGISMNVDNNHVINVSGYPDMQELICASDILISDYSSTLWDWSLTQKPAFIYAPDVEQYIKSRGFYMPIEDWGFSVAQTNEQLIKNIEEFKESDFIDRMLKHQSTLGSYEDGHATERIVNDIMNHIGVM